MARRKSYPFNPIYISTPVDDGEWRDGATKSRPLKVGSRVYVRPLEATCGGELSGWGGTVVALRVDANGQRCVDVRENSTRALRTTLPERCRVQSGHTKASIEAAAAAAGGS